MQEYLSSMNANDARLLFRVKSNMIELRAVCHYRFNEVTCRLCRDKEDTVEHTLNKCKAIEHKLILKDDIIMTKKKKSIESKISE